MVSGIPLKPVLVALVPLLELLVGMFLLWKQTLQGLIGGSLLPGVSLLAVHRPRGQIADPAAADERLSAH